MGPGNKLYGWVKVLNSNYWSGREVYFDDGVQMYAKCIPEFCAVFEKAGMT